MAAIFLKRFKQEGCLEEEEEEKVGCLRKLA
jgi:hypothetical protein